MMCVAVLLLLFGVAVGVLSTLSVIEDLVKKGEEAAHHHG
jgi:hypothetical protein